MHTVGQCTHVMHTVSTGVCVALTQVHLVRVLLDVVVEECCCMLLHGVVEECGCTYTCAAARVREQIRVCVCQSGRAYMGARTHTHKTTRHARVTHALTGTCSSGRGAGDDPQTCRSLGPPTLA